MPDIERAPRWHERMQLLNKRAGNAQPMIVEGKLTRMVGLTLEAVGFYAPVGARCVVKLAEGELEAEVVGFSDERVYLMPTGDVRGIVPNAPVIPCQKIYEARVGDALLGRVVDAAGEPLDGLGPVHYDSTIPLSGRQINPLDRLPVEEPLDTGVAAINSFLTVGRGQRMGLFAGSGVGKSVLLSMMTRYTDADVTVVGLIGERGREVKDFVQNNLGKEGMAKAVVVASPADNPPLMRLHGAWLATAIAEYFREKGLKVLLLMDSLTRFAQAQREIALAIGEPPATKGYPPSVFAKLPQLVERAGNGGSGTGSITAFYTVLADGDDLNDPIVDSARAILDGHIVLSRRIADAGHFPAIDIESSISRIMNDIVQPEHLAIARHFKQMYSSYQQNRDLINVGAYQTGTDPKVDEAIEFYPRLMQFLQQDRNEPVSFEQSLDRLRKLVRAPESME